MRGTQETVGQRASPSTRCRSDIEHRQCDVTVRTSISRLAPILLALPIEALDARDRALNPEPPSLDLKTRDFLLGRGVRLFLLFLGRFLRVVGV